MNEEIKTLLANIMSQLNEIMQVSQGEQDTSAGEEEAKAGKAKKENGEDTDEMEDGEDTEKGCGTKKSEDGTTASDTAEDRIDDIPEEDKEDLAEIAKALLQIGKSKKGTHAKKADNSNAVIVSAISEMTKAIKSISEDSQAQRAVINEMLEGLGVAKALTDQGTQATPKKAPQMISKSEKEKVKKALTALIGDDTDEDTTLTKSAPRDMLKGVLGDLASLR